MYRGTPRPSNLIQELKDEIRRQMTELDNIISM
jgi:hypothetical protein